MKMCFYEARFLPDIDFSACLEPGVQSFDGAALEGRGLSAYLAHRDTDQTSSARQRFDEDMAGLLNSRTVLAIAQNESPNWGGEVDFAYGRSIPVVALMQDGHDIPLILAGMITDVFSVPDLNDIEGYLPVLEEKIRMHL